MSTNPMTSRPPVSIRGGTSYLDGRWRWWRALPAATKWVLLLAGAVNEGFGPDPLDRLHVKVERDAAGEGVA